VELMARIPIRSPQVTNFLNYILVDCGTNRSMVIECVLRSEPYNAKLVFDKSQSMAKGATLSIQPRIYCIEIEFETEDDLIAFVLRWS